MSLLKVSTFSAYNTHGEVTAVPLFGPADGYFEKTASVSLLPPVMQYIENLQPRNDAQYVLVNALGASEFFGSNVNGDGFEEEALIHKPDQWADNPLVDRVRAKDWPYGFPTFYNAHPFAHHRNHDAGRAFGSVELVAWNDHMKRVELVARVDRDKCQKYGGVGTWDKLKSGKFADTSMGAKVPYDLSSITTDWKLIEEARATFDPKKHKHRGMAVLAFHEKLKKKDNRGIPGLAVTRKDYDIWCRTKMNQILGDGRKVYVHNPEPRFFDISFVFIGADRTSKVMVFIWRDGWPVQVKPSALVAEELGAQESTALVDGIKAAAATDHKAASIVKEVPSNLASAVVGKMTKVEPDLSKSMLSAMSTLPLDSVLSTTAGMGIVLKPREFQRVVLVRMGRSGDADALDTLGSVLPSIDDKNDIDALGFEPSLDQGALSPSLAKLLSGMLPERSAFAPFAEDRAIICIVKKPKESTPPVSASLIPELLNRIGAAYSGYRRRLMQATEDMKTLMEHLKDSSPSLAKTAADDVTLFTPLSLRYLETAYMDERA